MFPLEIANLLLDKDWPIIIIKAYDSQYKFGNNHFFIAEFIQYFTKWNSRKKTVKNVNYCCDLKYLEWYGTLMIIVTLNKSRIWQTTTHCTIRVLSRT